MPESDLIKIATFNIQHGALGDYGRGYPEHVADACKELDVDILGIQEVDVGIPRSGKVNLAEVAAEASGMEFTFAKARTFRGRGQFGNALLVRGSINDAEVLNLKGDWQKVKFGRHNIALVPEPRNLILANVVVKGRELAVGVTHLGGDKRREMLGRAAANLVSRPGPHILLGDFNLRLAAARECLEPYNFDVIEGPPTNPSWEPVQQIDHIALKGLRVHSISAHRPRRPVSDHLALVAKAEFAEP